MLKMWLHQWARLRDADKFPIEKFMTCSGTDANIRLGRSGLRSSGLHAIGAIRAHLLFTAVLHIVGSKPGMGRRDGCELP